MAIESKAAQGEAEEQYLNLRASPEHIAYIMATTLPFDFEAWKRGSIPPTPEELSDLEGFLREREVERRANLERQEKQSADLGE